MRRVNMFLWLGALAAFCVIGGAGRGEIVDSIVATVGDEVILHSEIMSAIALDLDQLRRQTPDEEAFARRADALMREALDQAIDAKILLRQAVLSDVQVPNEQVERDIERIRQDLFPSNGGSSETAFLDYLEELGLTMSTLRTQRRKQLLALKMATVKREKFEKDVVVSESDVAQYYEAHQDEFTRPGGVFIRWIVLYAEPGAPERATARARLEALREELLAGADFGELARAHSEAPGAADGGVLGWKTRGDLKKEVEDAAFALEPGGISEVLAIEHAVLLIKVERTQEAGLAPLSEVRSAIEPILRAEAAEKSYNKWMADLRKRSRVTLFL